MLAVMALLLALLLGLVMEVLHQVLRHIWRRRLRQLHSLALLVVVAVVVAPRGSVALARQVC